MTMTTTNEAPKLTTAPIGRRRRPNTSKASTIIRAETDKLRREIERREGVLTALRHDLHQFEVALAAAESA
jgi:hypothetical protein